jgi:hypothetical protein
MSNIPTAEETVNKWALGDGDLLHVAAIIALKEFAIIHVKRVHEIQRLKYMAGETGYITNEDLKLIISEII